MERSTTILGPAFLVVVAMHGIVVGAAAASLSSGIEAAGTMVAAGVELQTEQQGEPDTDQGEEFVFSAERFNWHMPDPEVDRAAALKRLEHAKQAGDKASTAFNKRVIDRVDEIRRAEQLSLSLEDALRRAMESSYAIEIARYNPAVDTTRVVEAEAAFDAVFFTDVTKNIQDKPTGSQLMPGDLNYFEMKSGFRKILPAGTQVSASYGLKRTKTSFQFQIVNPEYFSDIILEMRQPFLRGFGIDQNRSLIVLAKNDKRVSDLAFSRQVRDTLRQVEERYWQLVRARREVVITARLLASFEAIYDYLDARRDFDVIPVQLAATKADLERSRAEFVRSYRNVFDAEDGLIAAMNSSDIDLADEIEIIPSDFPTLDEIVLDRLAEVQTALDNRPEIKEDELTVASAKIAVGRAKNAELPRLDVSFRYSIDGLAGTADRSFDEASRHNYTEYLVGVEFEAPVGNRGPRAAHKRARLQHMQAVARLKGRFEEVILDVNLAVRKLSSTFAELGPWYESVEAREKEVESIVARAERMDINTLRNELNARQNLAAARRALLGMLVDYNISIIDLERAKGTLLRHYNVVIAPDND